MTSQPPTLRCVRRLGLVEGAAESAEVRSSLEHLVPKAKGPQFTDLVSTLALEVCWEDDPQCHCCPLAGECLVREARSRPYGPSSQ